MRTGWAKTLDQAAKIKTINAATAAPDARKVRTDAIAIIPKFLPLSRLNVNLHYDGVLPYLSSQIL
jgi:hypothetical protein